MGKMLKEVHQLRKDLHQHPELSGKEEFTARRIESFIRQYYDTEIITGLGGHGLAAVYRFSNEGPVIVIRCELDALPIDEPNDFAYRSTVKSVSHKCGHDGHMAIVAGLIHWFKEQSFKNGKLVLLFQPAEETGKGAEAVLNDPRFKQLYPDYVFALHNLPGEDKHSIIVTEDVFTATVQSVAIYLEGKQAHASEPEKAINPTNAIAELIDAFARLECTDQNSKQFALITPIYMQLGEKAYGIAAGSGELHYTIRTWTEDEMQKLKQNLIDLAEKMAQKHQLKLNLEWFDYFPAVVNDHTCTELVRKAAERNGYNVIKKNTPFRFGEDFGWFSRQYRVTMFGLGAGKEIPALHHNDYDFPDEIIKTGMKMFQGVISEILSQPKRVL
ncbi:MAG TPA: amidohydrolase [Chitinophagaceae bacterium]